MPPKITHLETLKLFFQALKKIASQAKEDHEQLIELLQVDEKKFDNREFYFVISGMTSVGKSSILNCLLDEEICPVDTPATTNNISLIRWGAIEKIVVHYSEGGKRDSAKISRDQIADYTTEEKNKNNNRKVDLIEININNKLLENGLVLIDTPGIGSLNPLHASTTFAIAPQADGIIFVSDSTAEITAVELDFLKVLLKGKLPESFLHVVSKADLQIHIDEILDANVNHLHNGIGWDIEVINAIAISSKQFQESTDEEDLGYSGYPKLFKFLKNLSDNIELFIAKRYATVISGYAQLIASPIIVEIDVLLSTSLEEVEALKNRIQAAKTELEHLINHQDVWNLELENAIKKFARLCKEMMMVDLRNLRNKFEKNYLKDQKILKNPQEELQKILPKEITSIVTKYPKFIEAELQKIYVEIEEKTNLDLLVSFAYTNQVLPPSIRDKMKVGFGDTAMTISRGMAGGVFAGTAGAGAVGGIIGGLIGTFTAPGAGTIAGAKIGAVIGANLGAFLGGIKGFFTGKENAQEARRKKIRESIYPLIEDFALSFNSELSNVITNSGNMLRIEFLRRLRLAQSSMQNALEALLSAMKVKDEKRQEVLSKLEPLRDELISIIEDCQSILEK